MRYLKNKDRKQLAAVSQIEARQRGCKPGEGTDYWYPIYEAADGDFVLEITDSKPLPGSVAERPERKVDLLDALGALPQKKLLPER